jgi:hypothetical protein
VEVKPGEAMELSIQKNIEISVQTKRTITLNGSSVEKESCNNWKSIDMMNCIENLVKQKVSHIECRLPMTMYQGKNLR